jgi:crossover junction endodeoxyribonuclease RuvC
MRKRRIMGIDPGLQHCGWGLITVAGNHTQFLASGRVSTVAQHDLCDRLLYLHKCLTTLLNEWEPDEVAVENTFVSRDAVASLKLGHARAIALLVPRQFGLPVFEYAPNHVKKSVVGVGHAAKHQVQAMIGRLLSGASFESPDAADALAIAICHAHQRNSPAVAGRL